MSLEDELERDAAALRWRCAHETATGEEVLDIARPGLVLVGPDVMVPREVFHGWLFGNAERLLRAHVGFGQLEEHEADWLGQGVALLAHPMSVDEETRGVVLMTLASLNTFSAIRHGAREMGDVYGWTSRALGWAAKRVLGDRVCPHDPVSLNRELIGLHEKLQHFAGQRGDARRAERSAQLDTLLRVWRETI